MAMVVETAPGFIMKSLSHEVKFARAFQLGVLSEVLETKTDWTELMEILMNVFDKNDDLRTIEQEGQRMIIDWLRTYEQSLEPPVYNIGVAVGESEVFEFEILNGKQKIVSIKFNDKFETQIVFYVRRMRKMESLKKISSEAASDLIENTNDIMALQIPVTLMEDVMKSCSSQWSSRWYRKTIK